MVVAENFLGRVGCRDPSTACREKRDTAAGMTNFGFRRCGQRKGFRHLEAGDGRSKGRPVHSGGFAWR